MGGGDAWAASWVWLVWTGPRCRLRQHQRRFPHRQISQGRARKSAEWRAESLERDTTSRRASTGHALSVVATVRISAAAKLRSETTHLLPGQRSAEAGEAA